MTVSAEVSFGLRALAAALVGSSGGGCALSSSPGGEPWSGEAGYFETRLSVEPADGSPRPEGLRWIYPSRVHVAPGVDGIPVVRLMLRGVSAFLPVVEGDGDAFRGVAEVGRPSTVPLSAGGPCEDDPALLVDALTVRPLDDDGDGRADRVAGIGAGRIAAPGRDLDGLAVSLTFEGQPDTEGPDHGVRTPFRPTPVDEIVVASSEPVVPPTDVRVTDLTGAPVPARIQVDDVDGSVRLRADAWSTTYQVRIAPFEDLAGNRQPRPDGRSEISFVLRTAPDPGRRPTTLDLEDDDLTGLVVGHAGLPRIVRSDTLPTPEGDAALLLLPGESAVVVLARRPGGRVVRARTRLLLGPGGSPRTEPALVAYERPVPVDPASAVPLEPRLEIDPSRLVATDDPRWPTALGVQEWSGELAAEPADDTVAVRVSVPPSGCGVPAGDAVLIDDVRIE